MERYESWLVRARSSLEIAKARNSDLIYYEDLCYQAQQAAEKAIKGRGSCKAEVLQEPLSLI